MKRFVSLLIGCSLALAGAAMAQQPEQQESPTKKKQQGAEKRQAAEAQPGEKAAKPQRSVAKERAPMNEPGAAATERGKGRKAGRPQQERANAAQPETNVSGQAAATPGTERGAKGKKGGHAAAAEKAASPAAAAGAGAAGGAAAAGAVKPMPAASPSAAPSAPTATQQRGQAAAGGKAKKPEPQQVQQIKAQHQGFRAQPKPQQVPAVTYNQNYRIQGSESWTGPQYQVFRSYRPEWHDEGWYRSHYGRVELIGGGYYFFNNGYWFPAWGYNTSVAYYPYDGPIYVGHRAEPPDQVIADVQAELQQMGYYRGEVDGLVGPLTREALAAYQADSGLTQTAAIDQPTLDSLGLT